MHIDAILSNDFAPVQDALKQLLTPRGWLKWWIFTLPLYKSPPFGEQLLIISISTNSRALTLKLMANSPPRTLLQLFDVPISLSCLWTITHPHSTIFFSGQSFATIKLKNGGYYYLYREKTEHSLLKITIALQANPQVKSDLSTISHVLNLLITKFQQSKSEQFYSLL